MLKNLKSKILDLFKGGFFHIFVGNTMIKLIAFVSSIVIVRLVSKIDYAYLTYADNLYNYVISLAGMGMTAAVLKYCASSKTKEEDKAYFCFSLKYGTLLQALVSLVVLGYAMRCNIPFPEAKSIIGALVMYPVLNNILNVFLNYLRAHGYNQLYAKAAFVQTAVVFVLSVILVLFVGVVGIAGARYIAIIVASLCVLKVLSSEMAGVESKNLSVREKKDFLMMSFSLMISNLFSLIMPINEMTLVNELLRDEVITANYKIAIMIPSQLAFVTQSIVVYYFTIVAKMKDGKEIWELSKKVGFVTAGIITVISLLGAILTPIVIRVVYGNQYEDAIPLSLFFWVVYGVNAAIRLIPMNFLPAIGIVKFNAIMAAFSCFVHVCIAYISIKMFGIWGAGVATCIVYLISGILYWIYYRKYCININEREELNE
ncbi:oligosaccharide flippase family protein [Faecalicatena contorta]|uniref:oligosaccharide flippase family protein n=1 Tax=Faecalicatena contorta TaxID=39482 RepID=UPI001F22E1EB|nr:oligosaccharide flippase family protein [Faecalicatena contorta]MCF2555888.1 oligosaccharide flippase family protein [Faecalicatena contorta]